MLAPITESVVPSALQDWSALSRQRVDKRYNVLPLDDRFNERLLGRGDLYTTREHLTFHPGTVRVPEANAPDTKNLSWSMTAHVDIPNTGADGPICVMGGHTNGWSLYVRDGKPAFCYNLAGSEITQIRSRRLRSQRTGRSSGCGAGALVTLGRAD